MSHDPESSRSCASCRRRGTPAAFAGGRLECGHPDTESRRRVFCAARAQPRWTQISQRRHRKRCIGGSGGKVGQASACQSGRSPDAPRARYRACTPGSCLVGAPKMGWTGDRRDGQCGKNDDQGCHRASSGDGIAGRQDQRQFQQPRRRSALPASPPRRLPRRPLSRWA